MFSTMNLFLKIFIVLNINFDKISRMIITIGKLIYLAAFFFFFFFFLASSPSSSAAASTGASSFFSSFFSSSSSSSWHHHPHHRQQPQLEPLPSSLPSFPLLLLLLGIITLIIGSSLNWSLFLLLFLLLLFLNSNKQANNFLGLYHVVLINVKLLKDVINLSLVHLVSPGHEGMLEHLDIDLASLIVGHESLEDEIVRVVVTSSHLLLEHVDHAHDIAWTSNLSHEVIKFRLGHEDTNVVKSSTEVILVQGAILVDVHQLEAVLVHLDLLSGEASIAFILSLAHLVCVSCFCC